MYVDLWLYWSDVTKNITLVLEIKNANINGHDFIFGLISRRSRHRAGTRYFSRGIDKDGKVSNFNETEMLCLADTTLSNETGPGKSTAPGGVIQGKVRFSFVQTRGSVPIYFSEINNLRYKPDLQIREVPQLVSSLLYFWSMYSK